MLRATTVIAFLLLAVGAARAAEADWTELGGTWSAILEPRQVVVQDEEAWRRLWAEHARGTVKQASPPYVDFTRETVVGVFLGLRRRSQGIELDVRPGAKAGEVIALYKESELKSGGARLPIFCQPFLIKKLPKAEAVRLKHFAAEDDSPPAGATTGVSEAVAGARERLSLGLPRVW